MNITKTLTILALIGVGVVIYSKYKTNPKKQTIIKKD
tara:strand:- start:6676 stop:6786 length:111 start_codon:yes stop_codon:yes gene_type:complete